MKTTIEKIAREAGLSPATVDRVLNDRPGVRERTRSAVLAVARRLGYFGEDAASVDAPPERILKLVFLLPIAKNQFMDVLRKELESQGQPARQS